MAQVDVRVFQAEWKLGLLDAKGVVERATTLLEAGVDVEPIVILAGLADPSPWEVEPLVRRVFLALGLEDLSAESARWIIIRDLARRIVERELSPLEGAHRIWLQCIELDYPEELRGFGYWWGDYGEEPGAEAWFDEQIMKAAKGLIESADASAGGMRMGGATSESNGV